MWKRLTDEITRDAWNNFVIKHGPMSGRFLQSWEWGEFMGAERWVFEEEAREVEEVGVRGGVPRHRLHGVAQVVRKQISAFGSYVYCPRGPVVSDIKLFPELVEGIARIPDAMLFFRFDPSSTSSLHHSITPSLHRTLPIQPPMTRLTDLQQSEDAMFASLHSKTRYNIRLADRHGVHTRLNMTDLDTVWLLFSATSTRGDFRLHDKAYYARMLSRLKNKHGAYVFLATAWYEDRPVAANIMLDFAGVRTYVHGASSYEYRHVMAPHLLHWQLMNDARQNGLTHYDWWGVSPENEPNHPWAGVSRFKRSFPGEDISYPGTYDLVKKPVWYTLYRLVRNLRRAL